LVWDLDDGVGSLGKVDDTAWIQIGKWDFLNSQFDVSVSADLVGSLLIDISMNEP
jgi:hypothetical protein